jgi:uncharacterized protein (DUF1499 family)
MMEDNQTETVEAEIVAETHPLPVENSRDWRGWIVFVIAAIAGMLAFFGPVGAGWGLYHFSVGIQALLLAAVLAIVALLTGLLFGWLGKNSVPARPKMLRWAGMLLSVGMLGWLGSYYVAARGAPLHDISTDLADPPQFQSLIMRADNLDTIPGADDPEMKGMNPQQRWVQLHQKNYGDIRSVRVNQNVSEVIAKADRLAKARGWTVALSIPAEGRFEATATSALFHFKDDVVLRVRPTESGGGSIVDMRSVSRVGQSDIGVNAKRVRSFLADLSGTVTAG